MNLKLSTLLLAATCTFGTVVQAAPQNGMPDPATLKQIYDSSRSVSGLITYCVDKGILKKDSLENAKKMVDYASNMPAKFDKSSGNEMEKIGTQGKIKGSDGTLINISDAPQGLDVWCKSADEGVREGLKSMQ